MVALQTEAEMIINTALNPESRVSPLHIRAYGDLKATLSLSTDCEGQHFIWFHTMPEISSKKRLSLSLTALFLISSYLDPDSAESTQRETAGGITVS